MFSDMKGYSAAMARDEASALALIAQHNVILRAAVIEHGGDLIKFIGDGSLSCFESAADAVSCAIQLQRQLSERNKDLPAHEQILLRIGIHIGDVTLRDGDAFGDGINVAARVEPLAPEGGICITQTVYDIVRSRPEIQTVSLGPRDLKNINQALTIYQVVVDAQRGPRRSGLSVLRRVSTNKLLGWLLGVGLAGLVMALFVAVARRPEPPSAAVATSNVQRKVVVERGDRSALDNHTEAGVAKSVHCGANEAAVGIWGVAADDTAYGLNEVPSTFYELGVTCALITFAPDGTGGFVVALGPPHRTSDVFGQVLPEGESGEFSLQCGQGEVMTSLGSTSRRRSHGNDWTTYITANCGHVEVGESIATVTTMHGMGEVGTRIPSDQPLSLEFSCADGRAGGDGFVSGLVGRSGWNLDAIGVQCARVLVR